jgi:hypothetical protein
MIENDDETPGVRDEPAEIVKFPKKHRSEINRTDPGLKRVWDIRRRGVGNARTTKNPKGKVKIGRHRCNSAARVSRQ